MSVPSNYRRGVLLTGIGFGMNIGLLFLEAIIAVRLLPPGDYGAYVLLLAVANFLVMAVDFGGKTSVTQLIASSPAERGGRLANTAWTFRFMVLAALSVVIWLVYAVLLRLNPALSFLVYMPYLPLMLAVASLDELGLSILQGFQAYRTMAMAQSIRSVLRLALSVLFLTVFGLGVFSLILSWILSFAVAVVYQYLSLPIPKRLIYDRPLIHETLRFGFPLQLNRFLSFIFYRVDVLLLGLLAGPTAVAFYEIAGKIPDALQRLAEAYTAVFFPTTAALLAEDKRQEAVSLVNQSLRLLSFATSTVALGATVFSAQIMTLLFSEQYAPSALAFSLLMLALPITLSINLIGYTLVAAGHPRRSLAENGARTGLNVLLDILFIPLFGFIGPAYAALVSRYAITPVGVWLLRKSDVPVTVRPYLKQNLILGVYAGLFWWLQPAGIVEKVVLLVLFVLTSLILSTITRHDLSLVLPAIRRKSRAVAPEVAPHGQ